MLEWILSTIICDTYEKEFRRSEKEEAMKLSFALPLDYDKEEGYRRIELLIIWKGYVGVFSRECWSVVPKEGIDYKNDCLKKGYDYSNGNSGWKLLSCHDSCWTTSGVQDFIFKNKDRLNSIKTLFKWYERIEVTEEMNKEFLEIKRNAYK